MQQYSIFSHSHLHTLSLTTSNMSGSAVIFGFITCFNACTLDLNKSKTDTMDGDIFVSNEDVDVQSILALIHCYNPPPVPSGVDSFAVHFIVSCIACVTGEGNVGANHNLKEYDIKIDAIAVCIFHTHILLNFPHN